MKSSTTLSVLVPVYNEEHLVAASLERLMCLANSQVLERVQIIVVDDGSSDRTNETIARFRARLAEAPHEKLEWLFIRHEKNKGKAAAIHTALSAATQELCVIHDADLEYHPGDLPKMVEVFLAEQADAVFGSRFLASEYRRVLFFRHELGNKFPDTVVQRRFGSESERHGNLLQNGAYLVAEKHSAYGQGFEIEPEITIKLAKRGARIFEVPIRYAGRTYQEGKKIGWRDGLGAIGAIFRYSWSDQIYVEDTYGSQILGRLNRAPRFTTVDGRHDTTVCGQKSVGDRSRDGQSHRTVDSADIVLGDRHQSAVLDVSGKRRTESPVHASGFHGRRKTETYPQEQRIRHGDLPQCGGTSFE